MAFTGITRRWLLTLVGATSGFFLALLAELTGHPTWTVLLMLLCLLGPTLAIVFAWIELPQSVERLRRQPTWLRAGLVVALVVLSFVVMEALGVNPRDYAYVPLLAPVIMSAVLLGFGPGLFAVILSTVWADYYYAPPPFDFALTEWEDAAGLAVFAILGAVVALMLEEPF